MRVVVTFHNDCRADLRDWLARVPGAPEDRYALLSVSIEELKRELARTLEHPAGSGFRETPPPPAYWWGYASECVVRYVLHDSGFFIRKRHIEIIRIVRAFPL